MVIFISIYVAVFSFTHVLLGVALGGVGDDHPVNKGKDDALLFVVCLVWPAVYLYLVYEFVRVKLLLWI